MLNIYFAAIKVHIDTCFRFFEFSFKILRSLLEWTWKKPGYEYGLVCPKVLDLEKTPTTQHISLWTKAFFEHENIVYKGFCNPVAAANREIRRFL